VIVNVLVSLGHRYTHVHVPCVLDTVDAMGVKTKPVSSTGNTSTNVPVVPWSHVLLTVIVYVTVSHDA
jgi:hypothetical protein